MQICSKLIIIHASKNHLFNMNDNASVLVLNFIPLVATNSDETKLNIVKAAVSCQKHVFNCPHLQPCDHCLKYMTFFDTEDTLIFKGVFSEVICKLKYLANALPVTLNFTIVDISNRHKYDIPETFMTFESDSTNFMQNPLVPGTYMFPIIFKTQYEIKSEHDVNLFGYQNGDYVICPIRVGKLFSTMKVTAKAIARPEFAKALSNLPYLYNDISKTILINYAYDIQSHFTCYFKGVMVADHLNNMNFTRTIPTMAKEGLSNQNPQWRPIQSLTASKKPLAFAITEQTLERLIQSNTNVTYYFEGNIIGTFHPLWIKTRNIECKATSEHEGTTMYILPLHHTIGCNVYDDLWIIESDDDIIPITPTAVTPTAVRQFFNTYTHEVTLDQTQPNLNIDITTGTSIFSHQLCKLWMFVTRNGQPLLSNDPLIINCISSKVHGQMHQEGDGEFFSKIEPMLHDGDRHMSHTYQIYQYIFHNTPACLPFTNMSLVRPNTNSSSLNLPRVNNFILTFTFNTTAFKPSDIYKLYIVHEFISVL